MPVRHGRWAGGPRAVWARGGGEASQGPALDQLAGGADRVCWQSGRHGGRGPRFQSEQPRGWGCCLRRRAGVRLGPFWVWSGVQGPGRGASRRENLMVFLCPVGQVRPQECGSGESAVLWAWRGGGPSGQRGGSRRQGQAWSHPMGRPGDLKVRSWGALMECELGDGSPDMLPGTGRGQGQGLDGVGVRVCFLLLRWEGGWACLLQGAVWWRRNPWVWSGLGEVISADTLWVGGAGRLCSRDGQQMGTSGACEQQVGGGHRWCL